VIKKGREGHFLQYDLRKNDKCRVGNHKPNMCGKVQHNKRDTKKILAPLGGDQKYSMTTEVAEGHFGYFYFALNAKYSP